MGPVSIYKTGEKKRPPRASMGFSDITHLNHIARLLEGKFMHTRHRIMNVSGGKLFSSCFDSIFSEPSARTPTYLHAGTGAKKNHTHTPVITRANGEDTALYSDARDIGLLQSDVRTGAMPTRARGS